MDVFLQKHTSLAFEWIYDGKFGKFELARYFVILYSPAIRMLFNFSEINFSFEEASLIKTRIANRLAYITTLPRQFRDRYNLYFLPG